jgi:hypothetical protein
MIAGVTWAAEGILMSIAQSKPPYIMDSLTMLDIAAVGVVFAAIHDLVDGCWLMIWDLIHH